MRVYNIFKPVFQDRWLFFWIFLFNLIGALLEGASFAYIFHALEKINIPREFASNILLAIGIQIARSFATYFAANGTVSLSSKWQTYFQSQIYRQILRMSFSCVNRYKTGDLVEYLKLPSTAIHILLDHGNKVLVAGFTVLVLLATMCFLSPILTLIAVVIFGGLGILQHTIVRRVSTVSKKYHGVGVDLSRETVQTLHGLRAIFTFHRQNQMLEKVDKILVRMCSAIKKMSLWNNTILPINEISGVLLVGIFLVIGLQQNVSNSLSMLMTFVIIVYRLNGRFQGLFTSAGCIAQQWGQLGAIEEILDDSDKEFAQTDGISLEKPLERIDFQDVHLGYPGKKTEALQGISFSILKGKMIAIAGPSGAGKSSILDLLLCFYEPTSGNVFLNGHPLKDYKISEWRKRLGVVSQDVFIFHDTIEENIRFGMQVANEKIIDAARLAGAADFIEKLPQCYQTVVGERGHRLSGGERQRIALARALLRDPELLILDEATSSLDSESELKIKCALDQLKGRKTLIVVAHRLSTICNADHILVINRGRIEEQGLHTELLGKNGLYSSLWEIQSNRAKVKQP
jgi:subfamily B ATP-binding cassette protein MsbA